MHPLQQPRAGGRWSPLVAALLGSAMIAAPAHAAAPAGGAVVPAINVVYNTAGIVDGLATTGGGAATVTRGVATIANGVVQGGVAPGALPPAEFGINSLHLALAGVPQGCWTGFTPQILPGDVVNVDGQSISIPDITAEAPVVQGGDVVVHGTAAPGLNPAGLDVQIWPAGAGRFAGGVGSSGGQFISVLNQRGFAGSFSFDPGSATHWTARFTALGTQGPIAANGLARVGYDPLAGGATTVATLVDYDSPATPGPVAGCGAPYAPNEAKTVSRPLINAANVGSDLLVNGVSQPGASAVNIALMDSAGRIVAAPALGAGAWSATVPAASLSGLADGPIRIASSYTIGAGRTAGGLLTKDTTAPAAPTASVASGTYSSTQNVELRAAEGTVYYTTDGSDPSTASTKYGRAVSAAATQKVKAIAVDAAGNASPVSSFDYTIAQPAAAPQPVVVPSVTTPKLKLDALTLTSRMSLRSARRNGMRAVIFAPEAAKVVRVRLLYRGRVITRTIRRVTSDGVMTIRLPSTAKTRRALRRGTYQLQVTPGASASNYGATTTRTIRLL